MTSLRFPRIASIVVGAVSLTLAACASYREDWVAPTSPQGTMCVAQCSTNKQTCEIAQQALKQQCNATYQKTLSDYQRCRAVNPANSYCTSYRTKTETVNGQTVTRQECASTRYESPCGQEPGNSCAATPNSSSCEANYKSCFQSCGGTINRYEVK